MPPKHQDPKNGGELAEASAASTLGTSLDRTTQLERLKACLLRSPRQWKGKPVTVLAVFGISGAGKSLYINTLLSVINGSPFSLQNSGAAKESQGGTEEDQLIPVHELLFPGLSDPPCYFFLFDTKGFKRFNSDQDPTPLDHRTTGDINSKLDRLMRGVLPSFGSSMQAASVPKDNKHPLPIQAGFCVIGGDQIVTKKGQDDMFQRSVSIVTAGATAFAEHRHGIDPPMPLPHACKGTVMYCVITKMEQLLQQAYGSEMPPVMDPDTGIDHWNTLLHQPRVVPQLQKISDATGVPYARMRYTFGLNTLRAGSGSDIRELAALVPFVDATCEVVARDLVVREQQLLIQTRDFPAQEVKPLGVSSDDNSKALPFKSCEELEHFFATNPSKNLAPGAAIVKEQAISGFELVRLDDEEIKEIFNGDKKHYGMQKYLQTLIAPFRSAAKIADTGAVPASAATQDVESAVRAIAASSSSASADAASAFALSPRFHDYRITSSSPPPASRVVGRWFATAALTASGANIMWNSQELCDTTYVMKPAPQSVSFTKAGSYLITMTINNYDCANNNNYYTLSIGNNTFSWSASNGANNGYYNSSSMTYPAVVTAGQQMSVTGTGPNQPSYLVNPWPDKAAMLAIVYLGD